MKIEKNYSFSCHTLQDKEKKNLLILDLIRRKGSISRTEISKITGINIVSVSNYVTGYIGKNIVSETGLDVSTGGRKPELIELNAESNYVIGVDAGPSRIKAVLTDLFVRVKNSVESIIESGNDKNYPEMIAGVLEDLMRKSGIQTGQVKAIGVGSRQTRCVSMGPALEKRFSAKVFFCDRALCAAFGEKRLNAPADVEDLLYVHSDLGRAVVVKKDICIDSDCRGDGFENARYLEPWSEDIGMVCLARKEISRGVGTMMVDLSRGRINDIAEDVIIEACGKNDSVASDIIEAVALNLGLRIAYLVNLFDPQCVVVGGGIEKAGRIFFDPVKKMVKKLSLRPRGDSVKIIPASLGEGAPSLGASSLAAREIFLKA